MHSSGSLAPASLPAAALASNPATPVRPWRPTASRRVRSLARRIARAGVVVGCSGSLQDHPRPALAGRRDSRDGIAAVTVRLRAGRDRTIQRLDSAERDQDGRDSTAARSCSCGLGAQLRRRVLPALSRASSGRRRRGGAGVPGAGREASRLDESASGGSREAASDTRAGGAHRHVRTEVGVALRSTAAGSARDRRRPSRNAKEYPHRISGVLQASRRHATASRTSRAAR